MAGFMFPNPLALTNHLKNVRKERVRFTGILALFPRQIFVTPSIQ